MEDKSKPPVVKDLGWANGWKETPEIIKKCKELKHETINKDVSSRPGRGLHNTTRCDICGYIYHYDSSG